MNEVMGEEKGRNRSEEEPDEERDLRKVPVLFALQIVASFRASCRAQNISMETKQTSAEIVGYACVFDLAQLTYLIRFDSI